MNTNCLDAEIWNGSLLEWLGPRVGVINVWTQNDPYNDPHDVILTSQMAVSKLVDHDNEWPMYNSKTHTTFIQQMVTGTGFQFPRK